MTTPDLLGLTMAEAVKDTPTVRASGETLRKLIHGVVVRPLTTHVDLRGSVMELVDGRWAGLSPVPSAYMFTIRPGVVKGWNIHKGHEDRYVILQGEMELVLYDPRPGSPTIGMVSRIVMSGQHRSMVNVPVNVWHADHNIGHRDAVLVNFPTEPYDHDDPDKYRLPIDTDLIPHSFGPGVIGW